MGMIPMHKKYQLDNASFLRHAFCSAQKPYLRTVYLCHTHCNCRLQLQSARKQLPMWLRDPKEPGS